MPNFRISQGELWHRVYIIEAPNLAEAKAAYLHYNNTGQETFGTIDIIATEPEYIEDIIDDVIWMTEDGTPIKNTEVIENGTHFG